MNQPSSAAHANESWAIQIAGLIWKFFQVFSGYFCQRQPTFVMNPFSVLMQQVQLDVPSFLSDMLHSVTLLMELGIGSRIYWLLILSQISCKSSDNLTCRLLLMKATFTSTHTVHYHLELCMSWWCVVLLVCIRVKPSSTSCGGSVLPSASKSLTSWSSSAATVSVLYISWTTFAVMSSLLNSCWKCLIQRRM